LFKKYNKNKNRALLKMYFAPPNLKTWLRAWREPDDHNDSHLWRDKRNKNYTVWTNLCIGECVGL